jgi:hypothetical protein
VVLVSRVAERQFCVNLVAVAASVSAFREATGFLEAVNDLRGGSLGYADGGCDVSQAAGRVGCDCLEYVSVVRHESPLVLVPAGV